jgi:hypothetical protein
VVVPHKIATPASELTGMAVFHLLGLSDALTREVRKTRLSPGYGHPVVSETARGTGPCRACLEQVL